MKYLIKNIHTVKKQDIEHFYLNLKSQDKRRMDKILSPNRKKQSIVGKMLLDELLKTSYGISYFDVEIIYSSSGKPYINNKNIFFSISHSFDFAACCISEKEIGIDIEKIREINIHDLKWFATENEIRYIMQTSAEIKKRSFQIFTLKEALLKMTDMSPDKMICTEFSINGNQIISSDCSANFLSIEVSDHYIAALCEKE